MTADIPAKPKMELILNTLYPGEWYWEDIKRKILCNGSGEGKFSGSLFKNDLLRILGGLSFSQDLFHLSSCCPRLCDPSWAPHPSVANYHLIISFKPSSWNSEALGILSFEYWDIWVKPVDPPAPPQKDAGFPEVLCHGWDPCADVSTNPESPSHKFVWRTTTCLKWV